MSRGEVARRRITHFRNAVRRFPDGDLVMPGDDPWFRAWPEWRFIARRELRRRHINYEVQP